MAQKKLIKLLFNFSISILLLSTGGVAGARELTGYDIAKKVLFLHNLPIEKEQQQWTLTSKSGHKKNYQITRYSRQTNDGGFRHLIQLDSPTSVKGLSILIWQHYGKPNRQWLYLPSQNRLQALSGRGQKNAFIGSDFNYEDLLIDTTDKFEYKRLPDETINNEDYFVLDIYPADKITRGTSSYKHRVVWIKKSNYFITKTDFYDRKNKLLKRRLTLDMEKVSNTAWREKKASMENFQEQRKTEVIMTTRDTSPNAAPKALFLKKSLVKK